VKRLLVALMLVSSVAPVHAQIAAAIGKPLPSPDLPPNSLSVRIVAGSPSSPVIGTDVTLLVNNAPRVARTDSAGRAHFKDLPPGAQLQAKVVDEDKKEVASETFQLPAESGARLMLSTRPWNPGAGAGTAAGGPMPNPRAMSGEPRPEQSDPPGTLTVRLSYDDFADAAPVGIPVALVGYSADGTTSFAVQKSDKDGRVRFDKLDRTGGTSYFAMTQLPRGNGIDRLTSTPVVLDPRTGARLILSSEKRSSTAPVIDDLSKLEKQDDAPAAGKVRIRLEGSPEGDAYITLVDAATKHEVGRAKPAAGAPDPSEVQGASDFKESEDLPRNMVRIRVHGGPAGTDDPMPNVSVRLLPAAEKDEAAGSPEHQTNMQGIVEIVSTDAGSGEMTAVVTINGKKMRSPPFSVALKGGELEVQAQWPNQGHPEAMFDLVPTPGQVVYAETQMHGNHYRSLPFQPVSDRGSSASLFILPRVLVTFSVTSRIDDEYLGVNGRWEVLNNSWSPYVGGPDGMVIPLPKGFTGGIVADKDQGDVAIAPGEGFRIVRPIAPGTRAFHGAFSLKVDDGTVHWAMDLPYGSFNSGMEILQVAGMSVQLPSGVEGKTVTVPQGTYYVLPNISILPKQSMVMTITGLPSPPGWRKWVPRIVGILVVLVMLGGLTFALVRTRTAEDAGRRQKRQQLLDELVELEKNRGNSQRRDQVMAELERLWDDAN